jgi:hypothetical protein
MDTHDRFTEEALRSQDGKKVPLSRELGGPVIGEVTLRYDPDIGALIADMSIERLNVADILSKNPSAVIFRRGE